jgi:hypothetical protein
MDEKKAIKLIFLDFFKDSSVKFEGRMDEGKISLKEIMDFISDWVDTNFKGENQ